MRVHDQSGCSHLDPDGNNTVGTPPAAADPLLDELAALRTGERLHLARGKTAFQAGRFADAAGRRRLVV